jgi:hypothetical protein
LWGKFGLIVKPNIGAKLVGLSADAFPYMLSLQEVRLAEPSAL